MRRKIIVISSCIVVSVAVMVIAWRVLTVIPEASRPIAVESAYAATDGGSVGIDMHDANGITLTVALRGDLERAPKDFPLYVIRWYGPVPVWRQIVRGSNSQAELIKLLRIAAEDNPKDAEFINLFAANLEERSSE